MSWYMQRDMLCKVITANSSYIGSRGINTNEVAR